MFRCVLRFLRRWWPSAVCLGVVLYATLWPDPLPEGGGFFFPGYDKFIHAVMMGGLSAAILFDLRRAGFCLSARRVATVSLVVVVFAVADEVAQRYLTAVRSWEILDILAGWGGIVIAAFAAPPVIRLIFKSKPNRA